MTITVNDPKACDFLVQADAHGQVLERSSNRLDLLAETLQHFPADEDFGEELRRVMAEYLQDIGQDLMNLRRRLREASEELHTTE